MTVPTTLNPKGDPMSLPTASPESCGVSPRRIEAFIRALEEAKLSTHSVRIARGSSLIFSHDWPPFTPDFLHRQYSVSKSFVSLAVGFAEQDGLLRLDDPIAKYFPDECAGKTDTLMTSQTIRQMLMMSTAKKAMNWFDFCPTQDRVATYFNSPYPSRPAGTTFEYDSSGSFVLGALIERLTGMRFLDYLRKKVLRRIGFSEEAYCLRCPGGHSWGDSGILCTADDLLLTARFVLNGGSWDGEQLLNAEYLRLATTPQIDTDRDGARNWKNNGYGYQFWMGYGRSFYFNGLGNQIALCVPEKDLILVIQADNQGKEKLSTMAAILDTFWNEIVKTAGDPLPEDPEGAVSLADFVRPLKLFVQPGLPDVSLRKRVSGVTFELDPNPMLIRSACLTFEGDRGVFSWSNITGDHELTFGIGENRFGPFPDPGEGYADEIGSVYVPGHSYRCAASGAWTSPFQFHLKVQVIDKYFGTMDVVFGFSEREDGTPAIGIHFSKDAEDFLWGYEGVAGGRPADTSRHAYI